MTNVLLMNRSFCYMFSHNLEEVFKEHPPVHFKLTFIEKNIFESTVHSGVMHFTYSPKFKM